MASRRSPAALALGAFIGLLPFAAGAVEIHVSNAWVHSALEGQLKTDAYLDVHADTALRLIGASTPWAQRIEVGDRSDPAPPSMTGAAPKTPASNVAPSAYHLVLIGIGRDIANGDAVPITLDLEDAAKARHRIETTAEARGNMFPPGPPPPPLAR
jgi:hypothetical protein